MNTEEKEEETEEVEHCECGNVLGPDDYLYNNICQECR